MLPFGVMKEIEKMHATCEMTEETTTSSCILKLMHAVKNRDLRTYLDLNPTRIRRAMIELGSCPD